MIRRHSVKRAISVTTCCATLFGFAASAAAREYDLTPHLRIDRNMLLDSGFVSPVGGYVRFWIARVPEAERCSRPAADSASTQARDYRREARDPITRLLWGRSHSRVLQASLTVTRSNVVAQTVTLASTSHDSNSRAGEAWTSESTSQNVLTPYIRVDQGSKISIQLQMRATRETDPAVTANLLGIARAGAALVAPASTLVTSLNADSLNKGSTFIDDTLKSLFRETLGETERVEFPANRWVPRASSGDRSPSDSCDVGRAIAGLAADFPMGPHVWRANGLRDGGEWRLFASEPHVSIFSDIPLEPPPAASRDDAEAAQCRTSLDEKGERLLGRDRQACLAFIGLMPSTVLGFNVGENVTLGESLRGDSGISSALQRFGSAGPQQTEAALAAAREICVRVGERAEALGLNPYDAAAALWAFASSGGVATQVSEQIWQGGNCTISRLARRLNLALETQSATPATPPNEGAATVDAGEGDR